MAHVIIGSWTSKCSECGGNAHPDELAHVSGGPDGAYDKGSSLDDKNGCGILWIDQATDQYGTPFDIGTPLV